MKIKIPRFPDGNKLWFPSKANDFVLRWTKEDDIGIGESEISESADPTNKLDPGVIESEVQVVFSDEGGDDPPRSARALISFCNTKQMFSGSFRFSGEDKTPEHNVAITFENNAELWNFSPCNRSKAPFIHSPDAVSDLLLNSFGLTKSYSANAKPGIKFSSLGSDYLNDEHPSGLVVVAGGTGTGKSAYARGFLIRWALRLAIRRFRGKFDSQSLSKYVPPHIVTYEDPIENWMINSWNRKTKKTTKVNLNSDADDYGYATNSDNDLDIGLRLTSRSKYQDVLDLQSAYFHALRQKPSVVYIGECRSEADWKVGLDLGGTGHLVVTTCHASSLVDTFSKLAGKGNRDAQGRRILASNLLGVVHLRQSPIKWSGESEHGLNSSQTFFTLWRRSAESVSNFVADGLSSLIPDGSNIYSRVKMARDIRNLQVNTKFDPVSYTHLTLPTKRIV